ncbi:MAG: putative peroxiredoxin bcp [Armatimonadota bacterium]|nr:MAG: putative peroxiredoxin bcp [Armatimonadota bacterium]
MAIIAEGQKAPDFSLPASTGETVSLSQFQGKNVVLYFYPKDDTPGCTTEACSFRDNLSEFDAADTVVLGVSRDDVASHQRFSQKYSLPFPLLADTDGSVTEAYGVWQEKNMYGKKTWGIVRSTFIIDRDGVVRKVFPKVKVDGHTAEVLEFIRSNLQ